MKRQWTLDELIRHFTLQITEREKLPHGTNANLLGFAVMLKYFQHEGYFPSDAKEVPYEVVRYIAAQLRVDPEVYDDYDWHGRSIKRHRAQIRQWLGFRPYTLHDDETLIAWLCEEHLDQTHQMDVLMAAVHAWFRAQNIEPPTLGQAERLVKKALSIHESLFFQQIIAQLPHEAHLALDNLLYPDQEGEQTTAWSRTPFQRVHTRSVQK